MTACLRLPLAAVLLAPALCGQFAFYAGSPEQRIDAQYVAGSIASGDTFDLAFHVRNTNTTAAQLSTVACSGTGFRLAGGPALPVSVAPGAAVDVTVRFQPSTAGSYSAVLRADNASILVMASAVPASVVSVSENGASRVLNSLSVVDFGTVERGSSARRTFQLQNSAGQALSIPVPRVSGTWFRMATAMPATRTLDMGQSMSLDVVFEPAGTGTQTGTFTVDHRRITLTATAVEPQLPKAELSVDLYPVESAQQGKLVVKLASASRTSASGQVTLSFQGSADPGVVFSSGGRTASFTIQEGDTSARFGSLGYIAFQTGSTAGNLVFTMTVKDFTDQKTVTIAPAVATVSSLSAARSSSGLQLQIAGFDNTRSVSQLSFAFYDRSGNAFPVVTADGSSAFRTYFANADLGGQFLLKASFPVSGDPQQIAEVQVQVSSAAGVAKSARVKF